MEYLANSEGNLAEAVMLPEESEERQEKEKSAHSAHEMGWALQYTVDQVKYLMDAESFRIGSEERQEKEKSAQQKGYEAKKALYLAQEDYYKKDLEEWANEREEQQMYLFRREGKGGIKFPEWLIKEIEERQSGKEPAPRSYKEKVEWSAWKQVKRLFPGATPHQEREIMYDWIINKRKNLEEIEDEWLNEVNHKYGGTRFYKHFNKYVRKDKESKESDERALERGMKDDYLGLFDPGDIKDQLTKGGWGAAIVRAVYIP
jgi:hypothetical protein